MLVYNIVCLENEFSESLGDLVKSNGWVGLSRPPMRSLVLRKRHDDKFYMYCISYNIWQVSTMF